MFSVIKVPVRTVPRLSPEGIAWRSLSPDKVEITIEISNDGLEPTEPGNLEIEAAPLGAFVPSRPVARIALGALEPGERRRVKTIIARPVLNRAAEIPQTRIGDNLRKFLERCWAEAPVLDWVKQAEWIGNLNIYFDKSPNQEVERHCAFGLRIAPGRPIGAAFVLQSERTDFRLKVNCSDERWSAEVRPLLGPVSGLIVRPPNESGLRGKVTVQVIRLPEVRIVPVEFAFETVGGKSDSIGCVTV